MRRIPQERRIRVKPNAESSSLVVAAPQAKLLHPLFYAKRDMFGGVAFGGFEIAVHEFGPRQGKLHIKRYRAGNFVIAEFGARSSRTRAA
jgi:hypothetical protein